MEILSSMFLEFLRSKRSELLWTDSEDSQAMVNLYQMMIKVITIESEADDNPAVNWV